MLVDHLFSHGYIDLSVTSSMFLVNVRKGKTWYLNIYFYYFRNVLAKVCSLYLPRWENGL